jgi:CheY-like chemotaxis protein
LQRLQLRDLDDTAIRIAGTPAAQAPELVRSDPDPVPGASRPTPATPSMLAAAPPTLPLSTAIYGLGRPWKPLPSKAERRAEVRRARLARESPDGTAPLVPQDVLVLDPNDASREQLSTLLEGFGFRACPARDPAEALALLAARGFAAVFFDVVLDGNDGSNAYELCLRARRVGAAGAGRSCALIIVGSASRPVERVHASLAGADQFLLRPALRGGVARALDACGVALPRDPRRA